MFKLMFLYDDNTYRTYEHITEVVYNTLAGEVSVSGEEFLKHRFPLGQAMYLYSETTSYVVSGKGLKQISVTKE